MKYLILMWRLAITPVYYLLMAATSAVVLIALGPKEFKNFWRKNK